MSSITAGFVSSVEQTEAEPDGRARLSSLVAISSTFLSLGRLARELGPLSTTRWDKLLAQLGLT